MQEGENITLFKGEVIRGSSLYIDDVDKLSKEAIQINRFIEVPSPELDTLLAGTPGKIRRSYPRADRVQQILYHLAMKPGRSDLENLVLIDPALAALNELGEEWQLIWRRRPGAAVRSSLLWQTALKNMPTRGGGYQVQSTKAQDFAVGNKRLEAYKAQHANPVSTTEIKHKAATPEAAQPIPENDEWLAPPVDTDFR